MGGLGSKPKQEPPRQHWTYLKGHMHTIDLTIEGGMITLSERDGESVPVTFSATLKEFVNGSLHGEINSRMNASVLPEALESANILLNGGHR